MNVRDAILQRVAQRFQRARSAFEQFDNDSAEREKVGPKWNVRDLAGHLAHWTAEAAEQVPRLAANGKLPDYAIDRVNDEVYRRNRRMNHVMLLPQLRASEERLMEALGRVEPAKLIGDTAVRRCIDEMILEHYDHHWPGLEAAVKHIAHGQERAAR